MHCKHCWEILMAAGLAAGAVLRSLVLDAAPVGAAHGAAPDMRASGTTTFTAAPVPSGIA